MASASIFFSLSAACSVQELIRPCIEYGSHVWRGSTHTALLNRVESKPFRLINSPPLNDCLIYLLPLFSCWLLFWTCNCMPRPMLGLATQDFLLLLILILSIYLMQELTSIFTLSSLTLVNSGTLFLFLFLHLPMTNTLSKEECQDTSHTKLDFLLYLYFSYCPPYRVWQQAGFFLSLFFIP